MFWLIVATLCSSFVKGICGFADGLVFTTILSFSINNIDISPLELMIASPGNVIIAWKERKNLDWKVCLPIVTLVLLGDIPGIFLLKNVDARIIKVIFGVIIIGMAVEMLFREKAKKRGRQSGLGLTVIGLLSGILCGLYGIGALLAAYMDRVTKDSHSFKGNLCFVFSVECTFRIIVYSYVGILTWSVFSQAVLMIPVMLLGLALGIKSSSRFDEKFTKKLVMIILMLSGAALIVNNLG